MNNVTSPRNRRAREKVALRTQILDAARQLFAKDGYEAVTMREVARRIHYTATALYYHFPDKESLLIELCRRDFLALAAHLQRIGRSADPVERIRRMGGAYVTFGLEFPQHYRLMFMTPLPQPPPERVGLEQGNPDQDAYAFLRRAVVEAIARGCFRAQIRDADQVAQMFWAGVHGLVALHLAKSEDDWVDWRPARQTARALIDTLLRGVLR
jgi:AcrR family transcriptional regulator